MFEYAANGCLWLWPARTIPKFTEVSFHGPDLFNNIEYLIGNALRDAQIGDR